jgi:hypothetical protein
MSGLRCKPGDLAVVVGPCETPGLLGRFVIVNRFANPDEYSAMTSGPTWWIRSATHDGLLPTMYASGRLGLVKERPLLDACLRPIRPNDGEDESLSWSKPLRREELA